MTELEKKIISYATDEGVLGKKIPSNPKIEFGYEIKFPPNNPRPLKLNLIKPKDMKAISIQVATQIAPQHIKQLQSVPKGVEKFFLYFKKHMLLQNLLYNMDVKNGRYLISDVIYPDGLTEHLFYKTIHKIFNASAYINLMLMELILGGKGGKGMEDMSATMLSDGGMFS